LSRITRLEWRYDQEGNTTAIVAVVKIIIINVAVVDISIVTIIIIIIIIINLSFYDLAVIIATSELLIGSSVIIIAEKYVLAITTITALGTRSNIFQIHHLIVIVIIARAIISATLPTIADVIIVK